uniref:Uncharacterized protein n=1 Tax=Tanacetum cinerariifolium TaxID=118510 RepID=A0A6L2JWM7_TANCI|nr:hypothetical protein [Tanacetum cinerariifolium]
MIDYSLWEVILNGDSPIPTRIVEGVLQPVAPTTAEQRNQAKYPHFDVLDWIRVRYYRPIREEGCASWDRAQGHMGRSGECFGTVHVSCRCTGVAVGNGVIFGGKLG